MWNIIGFILVVLTIVVLAVIVVAIYNSLVKFRNGVENAWSHINVELERRADLIDNLVETVKGYAKHEKTTLEEVTQARSNLSNAETVQESAKANKQLTGTLKSLFAVVENYPNLKADESFEELIEQLEETENMIAQYRQLYNDMVYVYDNKCEMFPSNIIAGFFGFEEAQFFESEKNAIDVPEIDFNEYNIPEGEQNGRSKQEGY